MKSKKIRNSARGEDCTLNISGVCNYDPETVVYVHFPDNTHGIGQKATDFSGAYGCSACHDAVDGRVNCDEFFYHQHFYMRRAQTRTLERLYEKGILKV